MNKWVATSIIDLVFILLYAVLLVLNVFNVFQHGFSKQVGYIFLVLVSCFKIVGNILLVLVETGSSTSIEVAAFGLILSQLGLYPLLMASIAFIRKWIGVWHSADSSLVTYSGPLRIIQLPLLAAFVCGIVSGVWSEPTSKKINTGYDLRRAAEILFLICILFLLTVAVLLFSKSRTREQRFDLVLLQVVIVLPILLIRIIYATVQSFLSTPTKPGHNTWVYFALLQIPDFAAVAIYTVYGFLIKPSPLAGQWDATTAIKDTEMPSQNKSTIANNQPVTQEQPASPPRRRRRPRRLRGPIGMLIAAIADRGE